MVPIKLEPLDLFKYIRTNRIQVRKAHIKELKKDVPTTIHLLNTNLAISMLFHTFLPFFLFALSVYLEQNRLPQKGFANQD